MTAAPASSSSRQFVAEATRISPAGLAQEVLDSQWGGRGFPVDPARIANQLGIQVIEMTLPKDVSGALIKKVGKDPLILLERTDSRNRKRFSCAHELGHYVHRIGSYDESYEYIDFRGPSASAGTESEEVFANSFAAALLMPEYEVRQRVSEGKSRIFLAKYFGVSDEALSYRLSNLNLGSLVSI